MIRFLARRIGFALVTIWVVTTVAFFMIRIAPGGPFDGERRLPPEIERNLMAAYHLDEPLTSQYIRYLSMVSKGDLGPSFRKKDFSVNELIASGLPISLTVGAIALAIAVFAGVAVGASAAMRHGRPADLALSSAATLGLAFPPIIMAPVLVLVFAVTLGWLPAGGYESPAHFVLPAIALALPYVAAFARLARSSCIETLAMPFVTTAKAKGLPTSKIVRRHLLPTAMVPVVSFLGPAAAALLAGSMVIEEVFSLPGLGRYFVEGALTRDYTLVMGTVVVYSVLVVTFNLAVDLIYAYLDPRIRRSAEYAHA